MQDKTASGIIVYLIEELGDARLRAQQLATQIKAAIDLVEESSHKDHFFEVAGHLIHGIPDVAFKLQKALDAAALAAAKIDYEEIKQGLKPEKVEELEQALEDSRLRYLNRRSHEEPMNPKIAADQLTQLAAEIDATGTVPVTKLARLIGSLERGAKTASVQPGHAADTFRSAAQYLLTAPSPSRRRLAHSLRRILAEADLDSTAGAGEEFKKENPELTDEDVKKIDEAHEKNKDVVKEKAKSAAAAGTPTDLNLFTLDKEVTRQGPVMSQFEQTSMAGMRRLLAAGYLEAAPGQPKGHWVVSAIGQKALDDWRARTRRTAPGPLVDPAEAAEHVPVLFGVLVDSAKDALAAVLRGNELVACTKALGTIMNAAQAIKALAPEHGSDLSDITQRASRLGSRIRSEARQSTGAEGAWAPFQQMHNSAKWAQRAQSSDNGPKACTFALDAIEAAANGIKTIAPEYGSDLMALVEKALRLRPRIKSEARQSDVLASAYGLVSEEKAARFKRDEPADPTEQMSEEAAAKWEAMNKEHRDNFKSAKLMSRQEKILKDYRADSGKAMDYDDLPASVRAALAKVKDQETLWSDVNRWLGDNR